MGLGWSRRSSAPIRPALRSVPRPNAARSVQGAARERYLDTGQLIPSDHRQHRLILLATQRTFRVLDLRSEATLDALGLDDRINTSHDPIVWDACHRLVEAAREWWSDLDGIMYRSRTTPALGERRLLSLDGLQSTSRPLHRCITELDDLVLRHRFTIGFDY